MAPGPRYFFVHLQKTGGTALFQRLRDHFGPAAVYPTPDDAETVAAVTEVSHLQAWYQAKRDELRLVTGHFPLCATEVLGDEFTTFTVLRNPVERTLSLLRRRQGREERYVGWSLEQIYDDPPLHPIIGNHMVKMLSLTVDEMTDNPLLATIEFDGARLELAKANLEDRIDAFGLQEELDAFGDELAARFGWDIGAPRFANRTNPVPVDDSLRERIATDNRFDVALYDHARRLRADRAEAAR